MMRTLALTPFGVLALLSACDMSSSVDSVDLQAAARDSSFAASSDRTYGPDVEICDEEDNDLDGVVDEDCGTCDRFVTRSRSFWRTHDCVIEGAATGASLLPLSLGDQVFDSAADVADFLAIPSSGRPRLALGQQIITLQLNLAVFDIGGLEYRDGDGDGVVDTVDELLELALSVWATGSPAQRRELAGILDEINNAGRELDAWFDATCAAQPEICNGADDDADGVVDEACACIEVCDGVDNNEDGNVDEGLSDTDGDGSCDALDFETCDGLDNNGDGNIDEGLGDSDADGLCDALDTEECDGLDNNGNGSVDEGVADTDHDGVCDALDAEECDGIDNDGDGSVDEDFDGDGDGFTTCGVPAADCSVIFDLAHGESTWSDPYTYDIDHAWGPAADLLTDAGYTWTSNSSTVDATVLDGHEVLVIAEPVSSFSADEIAAIEAFVAGGGGLLLATDFNEPYMDAVAAPWGVSFAGYDGFIGWTAVDTWAAHDITNDVGRVFWAYGSTLAETGSATVLGTWEGLPVYAAVQDGAGRVVFSADNEVFANYGLTGAYDPEPSAERTNETLWLNTIAWLAQCDEGTPPDCDDGSDGASPGAAEACNGADDDCDGAVDEGLSDTDGDGLCDGLDVEECDGVDNNGDGVVDEGPDSDGDGIADCFEVCEVTLSFCSAEDGLTTVDGLPAVATWDGHPAWTARIDGATWIWDEYLETDAAAGDLQSFFRVFDVNPGATGLSGSLTMAADNSYGVWLNGTGVGSDSSEWNYQDWSIDSWDITAALVTGVNSFEFEVYNWPQPGGDAYTNPGGLSYCVEISYEYDMDVEACDGIDNDCDGEVDEGLADADGDGVCDELDPEDCDGVDNDGDGVVDEDCPVECDDSDPACLTLAEAVSLGVLQASSDSSGVAVTLENTGDVPVCFDEQMIFTSDTTQAFLPDLAIIEDGVEIAAGGSLVLYYASWTTDNGSYEPYLGSYGWWCVESGQPAAAGASFEFYGEVAPDALLAWTNVETDADGDGVEDHLDWAGTYGVQTNYSVWDTQAASTQLTVGKSAVVDGVTVVVNLVARNVGAMDGSGVLSDTVPEGWVLVSATDSPTVGADVTGRTTLSWSVDLDGYSYPDGAGATLDSEARSYVIQRASGADSPEVDLGRAEISFETGSGSATSTSLAGVAWRYDGNGDGIVECDEE